MEQPRVIAQHTDLTFGELAFQNVQGWPSIHGACGRTAAELEASRQWGTVGICKRDCLLWRGCCPAAALIAFFVGSQAVHDVLSARRATPLAAKLCSLAGFAHLAYHKRNIVVQLRPVTSPGMHVFQYGCLVNLERAPYGGRGSHSMCETCQQPFWC